MNVGGVERSLCDLLKNIDYSKYDVDLVLFEDLGDYFDEIPKQVNIIFYNLKNTYGNMIKCIFENLKKKDFWSIYVRIVFFIKKLFGLNMLKLLKPVFLKRKKYDCAIAYRDGFYAEFVAYVVNARKKVLWWHNGVYNHTTVKSNRNFEEYCSKIDFIVAVSNGCKNMILENSNIESDKIVVIPNIIDHELIHRKSINEISEKFINKDFINIVSIGRLSFEKSMINCVDTGKKLIENGYKIKWYIIGDGPEYKKINSKIIQNGLQSNIILLGNQINPYPYLSKSDIYVHPSTRESMSITVIEALSLEKPVVVAKSMGPSEFIINKENGILVEPDVEGLYNGVSMLLNDENLAENIRQNNKTLLLRYAPKTVIKQIEQLIEC
ncbi:glycosyltransferase [Intestinibacter sp.]